MRKYGGELVYSCRDEHGPVEVVDDGRFRSLHFGTEPRQSTMHRDEPARLVLGYTRAMTCALLFMPTPRRILLLGLGGGSLARFLLHQFPDCTIDAVEYRDAVHRVAQAWFQLPESPRLTVHKTDAGEFVRQGDRDTFGNYDLLLVDAFDPEGMSPSVCGLTFFEGCRQRLSGDGALAINLWAYDLVDANDVFDDLRQNFDGEVLRLPVESKANIIALAAPQKGMRRRLRRLSETAVALQRRLRVEYPAFLQQLRRHNRWPF